ncbi:hypothetical protein BDQ12DRAFT_712315, partial [Crucibulum laeve]
MAWNPFRRRAVAAATPHSVRIATNAHPEHSWIPYARGIEHGRVIEVGGRYLNPSLYPFRLPVVPVQPTPTPRQRRRRRTPVACRNCGGVSTCICAVFTPPGAPPAPPAHPWNWAYATPAPHYAHSLHTPSSFGSWYYPLYPGQPTVNNAFVAPLPYSSNIPLVNPLLQNERGAYPYLTWDFTFEPTDPSVKSCPSVGDLATPDLNMQATEPPCVSMALRLDNQDSRVASTLNIIRNDRQPLRIVDILKAIYDHLHIPITVLADEANRAQINAEFLCRVQTIRGSHFSPIALDTLNGRTKFAGIEVET